MSLVHLFRTLVDLCGLPDLPDLDGASLRPLLADPTAAWEFPALTSVGANVAVRTERWRYVRCAEGGQELYDHVSDPHEWNNVLRGRDDYSGVVAELRRWIPTDFAGIGATAEPVPAPQQDL